MPTYILKPNRDTDFYVAWSTIVDGPTCWGTREAITEQLKWDGPNTASPDRFERADTTGTSSNDGYHGWSDDATLITRELTPDDYGWYTVTRDNLISLCKALEAGESPLPWLKLIPAEDTDEA